METKVKTTTTKSGYMSQKYRLMTEVVELKANGSYTVLSTKYSNRTLGYSEAGANPYASWKSATLEDQVNVNKGSIKEFKFCHHVQTLGTTIGIGGQKHLPLVPLWPGANIYYRYTLKDLSLPRITRQLTEEFVKVDGQVQVDYTLGDALKYAYADMQPTVDELSGEFGFAVFLAELRDFRTLVKNTGYILKKGPLMFVKTFWKQFKGRNPHLTMQKLSIGGLCEEINVLAAEARLSFEFAIKPLISDLATMAQMAEKLEKFIRDWNRDAAAHKVRVRHYDLQKYLDPQCIGKLSPNTISKAWPYAGSAKTNVRIDTEHKVSGKAHFGYIPQQIDYTALRKARAYFDLLGLGDGISLVWNVIPFSFVVDYVLSVDECLDQFSKNLFELPVQPAYFGYSLTRYILSTGTGTDAEMLKAHGLCLVVRKDYLRERVPFSTWSSWELDPVRFDTLVWSTPSLGQWKNLLALLAVLLRGR